MIRAKKKYLHLTVAELRAEATKLRGEMAKAQLDLTAGKLKNTRAVFNLRHRLAQVKSYANNHR